MENFGLTGQGRRNGVQADTRQRGQAMKPFAHSTKLSEAQLNKIIGAMDNQ